ncbi:unnamed protein product, partial [Brassica oleracea]
MVEESSRSSDPAVSSGLGFLRLVSVGILAWCLDLSHGDFGFSGSSCSRVSRSSRWSSRLWLFPFDSSVLPYCSFPRSGFVGQSSQHQRRLVCLRFLALCLNVFGSDCHRSFIYASSMLLFFGSRRQRMARVLGGSRWSTASRCLSVTPFVGCGISQYQLWSLELVGSVPLCPCAG